MVYYNVAKIGTGTSDDPFRPDVPDGVSWVGCDCEDGSFLIGTEAAIYGLTPMTDSELQNHCHMNGLSYSDIINKWFVS